MERQNEANRSLVVSVELERAGLPVEHVTATFEGRVDHQALAAKIAALLELETAEILAELSDPGVLHPEQHHGKLKLACIDLHFETDSKRHHFPEKAKWERVHNWGCKKFNVGQAACTNLELRKGTPTGPALNENKEIGRYDGCLTVWMVKPGPEPHGYGNS